ncbi:hypothetical protein A2U01_0030632, partial [Trifolium medium]|nr:hypothetical protein [Trifolium medium]
MSRWWWCRGDVVVVVTVGVGSVLVWARGWGSSCEFLPLNSVFCVWPCQTVVGGGLFCLRAMVR